MVSRSPTPSLRRILPKVTRVLLRLTSHTPDTLPQAASSASMPRWTGFPQDNLGSAMTKVAPKNGREDRMPFPLSAPVVV